MISAHAEKGKKMIGMDDYIKREALRDALYDADAITMNGVKILNQFPSSDVEPVKHGRWIHKIALGEHAWFCSECESIGSPAWKRCPMCETKMDGECDA